VQFLRVIAGTGASGNPYQISDVYGLQGIGSNATTLNQNYLLNPAGGVLDASATSGWNTNTGFVSIGNSTSNFTGSFNGNNDTINNLFISQGSSSGDIGLFGTVGASTGINNVGLTNVNVTGGTGNTGGLIGNNASNTLITNVYVTGTVTGGAGNADIGGIVGRNANGTISNSYNSSNVTGGANAGASAGGIVGDNIAGTLTNIYNTGTISTAEAIGGIAGISGGTLAAPANTGSISLSYNTGTITDINAGGFLSVGGLVGGNTGLLTQSYNIGLVQGSSPGSNLYLGGLVGNNMGVLSNSFNLGAVNPLTAGGTQGGIAGETYGSITNVYESGYINVAGAGTAAISGENNGSGAVVTNAFWDTDATGLSRATSFLNFAGATYGSSYGGCLSGTCTIQPNGNSANSGNAFNLSLLSTYQNKWGAGTITAAPGSSTIWAITSGSAYPYLTAFYGSSAPVAISGTASGVGANNTVTLAVNGSNVTTNNSATGGTISYGTTKTGANGK
jgi:hypothetical protein